MMKRRLWILLLLTALCLSLTVSAAEGPVYDRADLLDSRDEARLNEKLLSLSQTHSAQIVIVTVSDTEGGDADRYADWFYDSMALGYGAGRDGVLLVVCMDLREYRIISNGYAADAISSARIDAIGDAIVSDLSDGNYSRAFHEFADRCGYYLDGYRNGFPFPLGRNLAIALAVGLVIGLIVALILKAQLKSIRRQDRADVYMKSGSLRLTQSHDLYLYRNVTRRKRESSSSSSGSRSSRSRGGGSF